MSDIVISVQAELPAHLDHGAETQDICVKSHYETLLAERYDWMLGGEKVAEARAAALVEALGLCLGKPGAAVLDLGCGSGLHAKVLAQKGFSVFGVDLSPTLLETLRVRCQGLAVSAVEGDLRDVATLQKNAPYATVVCLGDTLTHLASEEDVALLVADVASLLEPNGVVVFGFRDMTHELVGLDRILTPQSDPDRILSVVLDYEPRYVWVNDIVHERTPEGWRSIKGRYRKLRLAPQRLSAMMMAAGLELLPEVAIQGLVHVRGRKRPD